MRSRNEPDVWIDDSARLQRVSVNDLVPNIYMRNPYRNESVPADAFFPDRLGEWETWPVCGSRQSGTLGDGDDLLVYFS